ncbi:MAG: sigma-70 family RNA polymerase sigma factor [Bacteroidales bacterium]|jgi:RNA polymerase sigma-70 factor (ECF subfamily)|nr:sigma-70 family RNA polymerase sigma factor [Bacteroidales bacterium]
MEKDIETIFLNTLKSNKDRIFRICCSYSVDNEDAKDLFQEVLINLWKSLPSFKNQSNIDTWVYRITINICLRAKQFSDKKQKHFVKLESISIQNLEDPQVPNENEKQFIKLSECIKLLKGMERSIILLYLERIPYKEIAQVFGMTENHVAVKIKRIKSKLFTLMKS